MVDWVCAIRGFVFLKRDCNDGHDEEKKEEEND
jgi:hypothetical protein